MSMCTMGDEQLCSPLFDLLDLVDGAEDPSLLNQIRPLIESPAESMRNSPSTPPLHDVPLHTFPDPLPLQQHYLHEEVAYRPEDQLPIWSLEPFCESSALQSQYLPCEQQVCLLSEEMEIHHDDVALQFMVDASNLQDNYTPYFQPITTPSPSTTSSRISSPLTAESTPPTPIEYTPWTLPVLYTPSPTRALESPFSALSSSSEVAFDASLCSPYTSTMESEPEFYEGFEPEPGFFPEHALDLDPAFDAAPVLAPELAPAYAAQAALDAQSCEQLLAPVCAIPAVGAQGELDMYAYPYVQTSSSFPYASGGEPNFTSENCHDGNYDEQYYLGDCEGVADTYSNIVTNTDGETVYCGEQVYENYNYNSGFADVEDPSIPCNMEEYDGFSPQQHTTSEPRPRANIHQVLMELNAMKPSFQSIPEHTKQNYAQFHNTLSKLASDSDRGIVERSRQGYREDLGRMIGVSQLSAPTKATAMSRLPARCPARFPTRAPASLARARADLRHFPTIDRDTAAKLIVRKSKRNVEMESKNPLDTFIKGSKVIRLTHSYQQQVFKPDPIPKKRKTKKEVIEHIHKQIPEFSSLPQPAPKPTQKKPSKDFWKTLENF